MGDRIIKTEEKPMNSNNYVIRPEEKEDYTEVEKLVREYCWNV